MALFELFSDPNKVGDSCTRHFEAPKGYFFIVRFYSTRTYEHNMPAKTHPLNGHKERLQNKTCSLKIVSKSIHKKYILIVFKDIIVCVSNQPPMYL